jgi:hypothetical protein
LGHLPGLGTLSVFERAGQAFSEMPIERFR